MSALDSPTHAQKGHALISRLLTRSLTRPPSLPTQYDFRGVIQLASTYVALGVASRSGDSTVLRCGDAVNVSVNGEFRNLMDGIPTDTPRPAMFLCSVKTSNKAVLALLVDRLHGDRVGFVCVPVSAVLLDSASATDGYRGVQIHVATPEVSHWAVNMLELVRCTPSLSL